LVTRATNVLGWVKSKRHTWLKLIKWNAAELIKEYFCYIFFWVACFYWSTIAKIFSQ